MSKVCAFPGCDGVKFESNDSPLRQVVCKKLREPVNTDRMRIHRCTDADIIEQGNPFWLLGGKSVELKGKEKVRRYSDILKEFYRRTD